MRLQVIGPMRVAGVAGEIRIPGPRPMAMLAMLVLAPGGTVARSALLDRFWGDRPDAQAAGALRQTLYALRQSLGDDGARIGGGAGTVAFDMGGVAVDLATLRQGDAPRDRLIAWSRAEVLEGLSISAPGVEEWLRAVRDDGRALIAGRLREAAAQAFAARDWTGARDLAQALHAMDPFCEQAMAWLLRLDGQRADLAGAQRRFAAFARALQAELGARPSPDLIAVLHDLGSAPRPSVQAPCPHERIARVQWRAPAVEAQWGLATTARTVVIEELARAGVRVFLSESDADALPAPFVVRGEIVSLGRDQTVLLELHAPSREIVFVGRIGLRWPLSLAAFEAQLSDRARALSAALIAAPAGIDLRVPSMMGVQAAIAALAEPPHDDTATDAPLPPATEYAVAKTPAAMPVTGVWQDQPSLTQRHHPDQSGPAGTETQFVDEDRFWFQDPAKSEPKPDTGAQGLDVQAPPFAISGSFAYHPLPTDFAAIRLEADWHRFTPLDLPALDFKPTEAALGALPDDRFAQPGGKDGPPAGAIDSHSGLATIDLPVELLLGDSVALESPLAHPFQSSNRYLDISIGHAA